MLYLAGNGNRLYPYSAAKPAFNTTVKTVNSPREYPASREADMLKGVPSWFDPYEFLAP
jgi:hypothetical protein